MIKQLWSKVSSSRPVALGLTLEGDRVSWLELDLRRPRVLNCGTSTWNDFVSQVSLRGRTARTVVQGRDTFYGIIEKDVLAPEELDKQIPFQTGTYQMRTCEVPSLTRPSQKAHFYAAAKNHRIEAIRAQLSKQGIILEGVEVPATAMVREFAINRGPCDHPVLLLHIGDEWTHMVIVSNGHPYMARDVAVGFNQFAYHWQMGKQCTEQEAREAIRATDVCQGGPLEPVISSFLTELVRSARSFTVPIESIYMSGFGVLPGLDQRLAKETGLTTVIDDSKRVQWRKTIPDNHRFKLPLGLAL